MHIVWRSRRASGLPSLTQALAQAIKPSCPHEKHLHRGASIHQAPGNSPLKQSKSCIALSVTHADIQAGAKSLYWAWPSRICHWQHASTACIWRPASLGCIHMAHLSRGSPDWAAAPIHWPLHVAPMKQCKRRYRKGSYHSAKHQFLNTSLSQLSICHALNAWLAGWLPWSATAFRTPIKSAFLLSLASNPSQHSATEHSSCRYAEQSIRMDPSMTCTLAHGLHLVDLSISTGAHCTVMRSQQRHIHQPHGPACQDLMFAVGEQS